MNVYVLPIPNQESDPDLSPAGLTVAEELAVAWSWAGTWQRRYSAVRVRQMRLLIAGALVGAAVAWLLDGEVAQKLDHLLTWLGWSA